MKIIMKKKIEILFVLINLQCFRWCCHEAFNIFFSVPSIVKFTCRKISVSNLKKQPFKMVFLQNSSVYNNKEIGVLIKMSSILISLSVYSYSAYI